MNELDRTFLFSYEYDNTNHEKVANVAKALHEYLYENAHDDYVDSNIVIDWGQTGYVSVFIYPIECYNPIPAILKSWENFIYFCNCWEDKNEQETEKEKMDDVE